MRKKLPEIFQSEIIPLTVALATEISTSKLQAIKNLQYDTYIYKPVRFNAFCASINKLYSVKDTKSETHSGNKTNTLTANILLVEDNKINQRLAMKVLNKMGHSVVLAENGEEAIKKVGENKFDIIFMDVQMPVMDGITATRELRRKSCCIPIIALTANAFDSDRAACLEAGMNDFASKPLERKLIKQLILMYTENDIPEVDDKAKNPA